MIVLSLRQVETRRSAALVAQQTIFDAVSSARISGRPQHLDAWGQFLDRPDNDRHVGVYGSSAAAIILASPSGDGTGVGRPALDALAKLLEPSSRKTLHRARDLSMTIKLGFVLSALSISAPHEASYSAIASHLAGRCLGGQGWGYYWAGEQAYDPVPRVIATAHALDGLAKYHTFSSAPLALSVYRWLAETTMHSDLLVVERLVGLRTLLRVRESVALPRDLDDMISASLTATTRSIQKQGWSPNATQTIYYRYESPDEPDLHDYMTYPLDVVALDALARGCSINTSARLFGRMMDRTIANVAANGAYQSASTNRQSTVDQLHAYLALQAAVRAIDKAPQDLVVKPLTAFVGSGTGRWVVITLLALLVVAGTWLGVVATTPLPQVLGLAIAAVAASMVAALLLARPSPSA